jgi:hypothetical protein
VNELTRYSPARVVGVTAGLAGAGAVFGGVAGAAALAVGLLVQYGPGGMGPADLYGFVGLVGAAIGAVCAPLAGWLLLRRVPLGRAFARLTMGTFAGAVVGWFAFTRIDLVYGPVISAAVGFLSTAVVLRVAEARKQGLSPETERVTAALAPGRDA